MTITGSAAAVFGDTVAVTAAVAGVPGVAAVDIRFAGQTLATLPAVGGTAAIPAKALSYRDVNRLYAVARTAAGAETSSAPLEIAVSWPPKPALSPVPTAQDAVALVRFFDNITAGGFNWDTTPPQLVALADGPFNFSFGANSYPYTTFINYAPAGVEILTEFNAREDAMYDFGVIANSTCAFAIDGEEVLVTSTAGSNPCHVAYPLLAGRHELRVRIRCGAGQSACTVAVRAPYTAVTTLNGAAGAMIRDFDVLSLEHCRVPLSAAVRLRQAAAVAVSGSQVDLKWSTFTSGTGYSVEHYPGNLGDPGVTLASYSGTGTAPTVEPLASRNSLRYLAPTNNDLAGPDLFATLPSFARKGSGLFTAKADSANNGAATLYRVNVPAGVDIYAIFRSATPPWLTAQGDWTTVAETIDSQRIVDGEWHISMSGTYQLELSANDGLASATDTMAVTVAANPDAAPAVELGGPGSTALGTPLAITPVTAADDGLPNPPAATTYSWFKISGPGTVLFSSTTTATTTGSFGDVGDYVSRLVASDGARTTSDDLAVNVFYDNTGNAAPVANAGSDRMATAIDTLFVEAFATDDGKPDPPATLTYSWLKLSGPGDLRYAVTGTAGAETAMKFTLPGTYTLQFLASDGVLSGSDTLTVTVSASPGRTAYAWGYNAPGTCGALTDESYLTATAVENGFSRMSAGPYVSYGVRADGSVWAAGNNFYRALGNPSLPYDYRQTYFGPVPALSGIVQVECSDEAAAALGSDGRVWTWGQNDHCQMGDGTTTERLSPQAVPGLTGVKSIACGYDTVIAIKNDGTVVGWGFNYGLVGCGDQSQKPTPVSMTGMTGAAAVACGYYVTAVVRGDGLLWTCGDEFYHYGMLGQGAVYKSLVPAQVLNQSGSGGYLSGVKAVAIGDSHVLALKQDGTVVAWGDNGYGQLGIGVASTGTNVPVAVPGLTGIVKIAVADYNSLALKGDGTLYAWGLGSYALLGNGASGGMAPNALSPVVVPGLPPVSDVYAKAETAFAVTPCRPGVPPPRRATTSSPMARRSGMSSASIWAPARIGSSCASAPRGATEPERCGSAS